VPRRDVAQGPVRGEDNGREAVKASITAVAMRSTIHNGHVLGAAGFLAPVLGVYAPRSLAALLVVATVAAIALRRAKGEAWPVPRQRVASILALALVWALVSVTWGIEAKTVALSGIARLTLVVVCGLVLHQIATELGTHERDTVRRWLVAGFVLALALLSVDRVSGAAIRRLFPMSPALENPLFVMENFNRGASVLVLLSFPVALALWRVKAAYAVAAWAACFILAFTLPSGSARLAIVAGGLAACCAWIAPRVTTRSATVLLAAIVLAAPLLASAIPPPDKLPTTTELPISNSGHHRLQIWRFAADRIAERPITGWGYDSSRVIPGGNENLASAEPALPLHPHNAMLQWWLELGLPGGLIGAIVLAAIALTLGQQPTRPAIAAATGQLVAAFTMANLSFGIWQGWWVAVLILSAAMAATVRDER